MSTPKIKDIEQAFFDLFETGAIETNDALDKSEKITRRDDGVAGFVIHYPDGRAVVVTLAETSK